MATAELVILSSSPNDIPKRHIYSVPTSPDRFAPALAQKKVHRPVLKSGSHAGEVPLDASAGFRSASLLVKDIGIGFDTNEDKKQQSESTLETLDKQKNDDNQGLETADPSKGENEDEGIERSEMKLDMKGASRKPVKFSSKARRTIEHDEKPGKIVKVPKQAKSRKKRTTPSNFERLEADKDTIAKPSPVGLPLKTFQYPPGLNQTASLSNHFAVNMPKDTAVPNDCEASTLPKQKTKRGSEGGGSDSGKENNDTRPQILHIVEDTPISLKGGSSRLEAASETQEHTASKESITEPPKPRTEDGVPVSKRRRMEATKSRSPTKKIKQPSKSSRTVTGIALRAFIPPDDESATEAAITEFFSPPIPSEEKVETSKKARKRSKSPKKAQDQTKTKAASKPSKRSAVPPTSLLSPPAAKRKMAKQNFLFGTSSQLVQEESPAFILELQQVLDASGVQVKQNKACAAGSDNARLIRSRRDLWLSGARSRIENEKTVELYDPADFEPKTLPEDTTMQTASSDFMDIDALNTSSPHNPSVAPVPLPASSPPRTQSLLQESQPQMSRLRLASLQSVRPKSTLKCAMDDETNINDITTTKIERTAELPVLGRKTLGIAQPETKAKAPPKTKSRKKAVTEAETTAPKKPRGRPRKTPVENETPKATKRSKKSKNSLIDEAKPAVEAEDFVPIDEISDHEPCPTPSPPRRADPTAITELELMPIDFGDTASNKKSSSVPHIPSKPYQDELFPHLKLHLFKRINTAIKSVPRSTNPQNLTWHEKILLYDPIVLEDLTDWLNAGPLEKAGFDQFSASVTVPVKRKDGTDYGGKNKYKTEMLTKHVSVQAGEVEPWMVQKWCQEMSVCCLWRESLWGGARSRY